MIFYPTDATQINNIKNDNHLVSAGEEHYIFSTKTNKKRHKPLPNPK